MLFILSAFDVSKFFKFNDNNELQFSNIFPKSVTNGVSKLLKSKVVKDLQP